MGPYLSKNPKITEIVRPMAKAVTIPITLPATSHPTVPSNVKYNNGQN